MTYTQWSSHGVVEKAYAWLSADRPSSELIINDVVLVYSLKSLSLSLVCSCEIMA